MKLLANTSKLGSLSAGSFLCADIAKGTMASDFHRPADVCLPECEVENWEDDNEIDSDVAAPLLSNPANSMEVKDRYSVVYMIFYLLGLGSLLPWNFFITANDYWMYKLRDVNATVPADIVVPTSIPKFSTTSSMEDFPSVSSTDGEVTATSLQSLFMNSLAICAMLPNVIFQFLNTVLQKRIPQNTRILTTLAMMILLFIFTEIMVKVDTSKWQSTFFTVTLVSVVLINSCCAVFQSSVFGLAARLPQKYCAAVMAGQGMGGVFAALAMIISLALGSNPTDSALIFFLTAIIVLVLTMLCYFLLTKLKFFRFFTEDKENEKVNGVMDVAPVPLQPSLDDAEEDTQFLAPEGINNGDVCREHDAKTSNEKCYSAAGDPSSAVEIEINEASLLSVAKKIWLHMFCITYTFIITLACFPAVTAKIKSSASKSEWSEIYFTPVCCFLLYNLMDWLGRTSASHIHVPGPNSKVCLVICVLLRTVFLFLFALCNYQPRHNLPVVFHKDAFFITFMVIFGISNGHLSTLCMQYGPKQVEPENAATAGSMLAFMLSVGLLGGAGLSFALCSII